MMTERLTRDAPVYNNESFWWSAPVRENYLGLDRGPTPNPTAAAADGIPVPRTSSRRPELPTQWAAQPAGW